MPIPLKQWTLMPGAEVIEAGEGAQILRAQFGVPPCVKLWFQKKLPPPTTFILPDEFFRAGVVQVCLEFFVYYFLFVMGKAFGKLPAEAKLTVVGTPSQIKRAKRILEVTLFGFSPQEMHSWTIGRPGQQTPAMSSSTILMLRQMRAWFAPKKAGFANLVSYVKGLAPEHELHPLVTAFLAAEAEGPESEKLLRAYESALLDLDEIVEWRAFNDQQETLLFPGVSLRKTGLNLFEVSSEDTTQKIDLNFTEDPAAYLLALPPSSAPVESEAFSVVCMGSDSGFELEHPTTGFAICLNGSWAVVDAPVCASYLLSQHGIDPSDVRVVMETHGHEDHMGSAIHFLLECLTAGRSYTYLAAEPVYRTCVAKVAAILGIPEEDADQMLTRGHREEKLQAEQPAGGVLRVTPGVPLRLLGATWNFVWMVHPIPTTGFRITLEHQGKTSTISYSSDTAPANGFMGLNAMIKEGFFDPKNHPFPLLVKGDEELVFWEAGGTYGDPIHFDAREWDGLCASYNVRPTVVFMHTHPMPPQLRRYALARPGMVWTVLAQPHIPTSRVIKLSEALNLFRLHDTGYWLRLLLSHGQMETYTPGATIVAEGDPGDAWFIILQGRAETLVGERVVCTLRSGSFFGELALLGEGRRKATVRAQSPMIILRVPPDTFRDFVVANGLWDFFPKFWDDVDLIRQTRLFWGFPHDVVAHLAKHSERRTYPKDTVIIEQGAAGHELFVIVKGQVGLSKLLEDGSREALPSKGVGEVIGEYGVLVAGARRAATAVTETELEVLVLTGNVLEQVLAGQIPLQLRLVAMLSERGMPVPRLGTNN